MIRNKRQMLFIAIILIFILSLSGCGIIMPFSHKKEANPVSNLTASSLLVDSAEIRLETIKLIENAKKTIFIELSALDDPEITNLIVVRSHAGIEVRILLDQWQRENATTVKNLKNQNISVQYYPAQKGQYQRIRYMVIDYQVAVFYGQDWLQKGLNDHSLAVKLTGDTAWTIAKSFSKDWEYTTTLTLNLPGNVTLPEDNITLSLNGNVKRQIINAINNANTEIFAEVEQISEPETVKALVAAKQRGCNIRLIVSPSCAEATPDAIADFKKAQIEVCYYNPSKKLTMSLNLCVFDNKTMIMSSSSWSYYSFVINHEGSLKIPAPQAIGKIKTILEGDWDEGTPY